MNSNFSNSDDPEVVLDQGPLEYVDKFKLQSLILSSYSFLSSKCLKHTKGLFGLLILLTIIPVLLKILFFILINPVLPQEILILTIISYFLFDSFFGHSLALYYESSTTNNEEDKIVHLIHCAVFFVISILLCYNIIRIIDSIFSVSIILISLIASYFRLLIRMSMGKGLAMYTLLENAKRNCLISEDDFQKIMEKGFFEDQFIKIYITPTGAETT